MGGEWATVRLRDVSEVITKGTTPTTLGMSFVTNGINYIKSESITSDGFIDSSKFAFIDEETHEALKRSQIEPFDLLFSMAGVYLGKTALVPPSLVPANTNQAVAIIRLKKGDADPRFIGYSLRNPRLNAYVNKLVGQSAQPNINLTEIGNLEIALPSFDEQRAIAHILGTLDDKIELNRRMNETLEAIARAIFKSWFVNFDPVRAKASGEPPESICRRLGLTPDVLALFPDRLVDSELGEIPEGWSISSLYEMATYINGAAYSAFEPNEEQRGLPIIKIAELKAGVTAQTKYSDVVMPEKYQINRGDILFSWSGNPDTSIDTFVWTNGPAWLNQHIFRVVPHSELERSFVLAMLKYLRPVFAEIARNKQTTGLGHVTVSDLKRLKCVKPPKSLLVSWNEVIDPILERAFLSGLETQTLADSRDTLLPKLLSGEMRVAAAGTL